MDKVFGVGCQARLPKGTPWQIVYNLKAPVHRSILLAPAMAPPPLPWWLMGAWEGFALPAASSPVAAPAAPPPSSDGGRYFSSGSQSVSTLFLIPMPNS